MIYVILQGNTYIVNMVIKEIIPGQAYIECEKCKRTATQNGSFQKCIKCGVTTPETRFGMFSQLYYCFYTVNKFS